MRMAGAPRIAIMAPTHHPKHMAQLTSRPGHDHVAGSDPSRAPRRPRSVEKILDSVTISVTP